MANGYTKSPSMAKQIDRYSLTQHHDSSIQYAHDVYWYLKFFFLQLIAMMQTVFFQINSNQMGFCLQWILINNSPSVNDYYFYWLHAFEKIFQIMINAFCIIDVKIFKSNDSQFNVINILIKRKNNLRFRFRLEKIWFWILAGSENCLNCEIFFDVTCFLCDNFLDIETLNMINTVTKSKNHNG